MRRVASSWRVPSQDDTDNCVLALQILSQQFYPADLLFVRRSKWVTNTLCSNKGRTCVHMFKRLDTLFAYVQFSLQLPYRCSSAVRKLSHLHFLIVIFPVLWNRVQIIELIPLLSNQLATISWSECYFPISSCTFQINREWRMIHFETTTDPNRGNQYGRLRLAELKTKYDEMVYSLRCLFMLIELAFCYPIPNQSETVEMQILKMCCPPRLADPDLSRSVCSAGIQNTRYAQLTSHCRSRI